MAKQSLGKSLSLSDGNMSSSGDHFLDSFNNLLGRDAIHVHENTARPAARNASHSQAMDTHIEFLTEGSTHSLTKST